jgi:hypothetical protein
MPWKTSSAMDEKLGFIFEYERDEQTKPSCVRGWAYAVTPAMYGFAATGSMG